MRSQAIFPAALMVCLLLPQAFAALNSACDVTTGAACNGTLHEICEPDREDPSKGSCQCDKKYTPDSLYSNCISAIGQVCSGAAAEASCNAIPYALCQDDNSQLKCLCTQNYAVSTGEGEPACQVAEYEDRCLEDSQCAHFNASCVNERCECPAEFVQGPSKCLKTQLLDDACEDDVQCPENSICRGLANKSCKCNDYFVLAGGELNKYCVPKANKIGDSCEIKGQCENLDLEDAITPADCIGGKCQCAADHVGSLDEIFCLPRATVAANNFCQQDQQCADGEFCNFPKCEKIPAAF